jgi:hypothetical protein
MFELTCDGHRASWLAYVEVGIRQVPVQLIKVVSPFQAPDLTQNRGRK